jgi:hypothetical protein
MQTEQIQETSLSPISQVDSIQMVHRDATGLPSQTTQMNLNGELVALKIFVRIFTDCRIDLQYSGTPGGQFAHASAYDC